MSEATVTLKSASPRNRVKRLVHRARIAARYWLLPRREFTPLFILASARTGSTLLGDYLNSIPRISVASEILSPTLPCGVPARGLSKAAVLRHIGSSLNALPGAIAGAKFLLRQLSLHGLTLDDLRTSFPAAKYLVLYRASLTDQFVSFQAARTSGKWVGRGDAEHYDCRVRVNPADFLSFCQRQREAYGVLLGATWMPECGRVICYEDLVADVQSVFDSEILPFLGLPRSTVATTMMKQRDRPLSEVVENYAEVQHLFAAHGTQRWSIESSPAGRASPRIPIHVAP